MSNRKLKTMDTALLTLAVTDIAATKSPEDQAKIRTAVMIAADAHINQFRKAPRSTNPKPPYVEHVLRVALRINRYFDVDDTDLLIAGLLHDVVEDSVPEKNLDTAGILAARAELLDSFAARFGDRVANTVAKVTNPVTEPTVTAQEKKRIYQDHVTELMSDTDALIVKVSDFIDNAGSMLITEKNHPDQPSVIRRIDKYAPLMEKFIGVIDQAETENRIKSTTATAMTDRLRRVETDLTTLAELGAAASRDNKKESAELQF